MCKKLLMIVLLSLPLVAHPQPTPVVEATADRILIGQTVELLLELRAVPRTATVRWLLPDSLPHFQYLYIDSSLPLRRVIKITSWDSGAWNISGIQAAVQTMPKAPPVMVAFPQRIIRVDYDTTGPQVLNSIKPIIENEETTASNQLLIALLAAVLLSTALLLWFFRRKKKEVPQPAAEPRNAWNIFLQQMQQLQQQPVATAHERKELFIALSHALYGYFENRTGMRFRQYTSDACIGHLHQVFPLQQHTELLQLLRLTDAVKFARYDAGPEGCATALETARMLIHQIDQQQPG